MANIPIRDIPGAAVTDPNPSNLIPMDNGTIMQKTTISAAAQMAIPLASQAEAEAGVNNFNRMSALRVKQSIAAEAGVTIATIAQGALASSAVQPSRTISAGTGLTGGGDLSANRSLALSGTSIASLALADTSVQPARTIATGTGLTGGGNLSANRTIALDANSIASLSLADTAIQPSSSRLLPSGGTTGQVLAKTSGTDYAVGWSNAGSGDMAKAVYDPQNINADAFDRANFTGPNIPDDGSVTAQKLSISSVRPAVTGTFNTLDYGAAPSNTYSQNKTALQDAISACDAAGGGVVLNPWPIDYGYDLHDEATAPDFTGVVNDMMIMDFSPGAEGYTSAGAKQGWVEKRWYHTPQTSPAGQHDGNGFRVLSDWHPYAWVSSEGNYIPYGGGSGGRDANYNYRASYFLGYMGKTVWQICQGVTRQGNHPDAELLDFAIIGYNDAGAGNEYYPLVVNYGDGAQGYGIGTSNPDAAHYFHHHASVTGKDTVVFATDGTRNVTHRFQRGTSYDAAKVVTWSLSDTQFNLQFPNLGNAMQFDRASRNLTLGGNLGVSGALSKGSGTFLIDHPLDPENKDLAHGFIEGPRYDLIYRGAVRLVKGRAWVDLDATSKMSEGTFEALTTDAQVTGLQNQEGFARLRPGPIVGGRFEIISEDPESTDLVAWTVIAERNDAFVKSGLDPNTDENGRFIPERWKEEPEAEAAAALDDHKKAKRKSRKAGKGKRLVERADERCVGKRGMPRHPQAFGMAIPKQVVEIDDEPEIIQPSQENAHE